MAKEEKAPKAEKRKRLEYGCFTADPFDCGSRRQYRRYLSDESLLTGKTAAAETAKDSSKISSDEAIVALDEFLVNLAKEDNQEQQYMKVNLSILVADEEKARKLRKMWPSFVTAS